MTPSGVGVPDNHARLVNNIVSHWELLTAWAAATIRWRLGTGAAVLGPSSTEVPPRASVLSDSFASSLASIAPEAGRTGFGP